MLMFLCVMFLSIRMAMTSEVQSQLSKRNVVGIGGNLAVEGHQGGGAANAVLSHQLSEASSIEFIASAGLRSLIGVQTSRLVICFLQIYLNSVLLSVLVMIYVFLVHHAPALYHHTHLQQQA
jgi:hypothetical protein